MEQKLINISNNEEYKQIFEDQEKKKKHVEISKTFKKK
jgi:hypothetical protein